MTHQHEFKRDHWGKLVCYCGNVADPYYRDSNDYKRWKGHKGIIFRMLSDAQGKAVPMTAIKERIDSANPSTHVSGLRKDGYIITCTREGNESFYTLEGFTGIDNTAGLKCPQCGYHMGKG